MMVRTIQHPGVQIQESEIGSYSSTVIMNNAYIMGFTDRGPIYDYSYVTTTREFTKIYGEPQTEAEKYLFLAVQSVLQNGGTPIVARMPYDNKQCKAYKALKMKWSDKTDLIAPKKDTDLATPVVPLDELTRELDQNKSFREIFSDANVSLGGKPVSGEIDSLTIPQAAMLLSPYKTGDEYSNGEIYPELKGFEDLKINGVYPSALHVDQAAVSSIIDSFSKDKGDQTMNVYKYDEGYNVIKYYGIGDIDNAMASKSTSGVSMYKPIIKVNYKGKDEDSKVIDKSFFVDLLESHAPGDELYARPIYGFDSIPLDSFMKLSGAYSDAVNSADVSGSISGDISGSISGDTSGAISGDISTIKRIFNLKWSSEITKSAALSISGYADIKFLLEKLGPTRGDWTTAETFEEISLSDEQTEAVVASIVDSKPIGFYDLTSTEKYIINPVAIVNVTADEAKEANEARCVVYNASNIWDKFGSLFKAAYFEAADLRAENIDDKFMNVFHGEKITMSNNADNGWTFIGLQVGSEKGPKSSIHIDSLLPVFSHTYNFWKTTPNGTVTRELLTPSDIKLTDGKDANSSCKLIGFINCDVETPAVDGSVMISDLDASFAAKLGYKNPSKSKESFPVWSASYAVRTSDTSQSSYLYDPQNDEITSGMLSSILENPPSAEISDDNAYLYINCDFAGQKDFFFNTTKKSGYGKYSESVNSQWKGSGNVSFTKYWEVSYTYALADVPIKNVDDAMIVENEQLVWLRTIYNDVRLLNLDKDNYTLLEAKLLNTPEMGFKYGLYLDSENCEISNEQFDDLVTVNQFKAVDRSVDKYGQDIDDANFIIVDKQKTVVQGTGGNVGYFTVIVDPFDALKAQRTLVNPTESAGEDPSRRTIGGASFEFEHTDANIHRLDYWAYESADSWNKIYEDLLDSMDCLQRVRNADGIYIGEANPVDGKQNIMDSWSIPLTGTYYQDSISRQLMRKFPAIPMADITSEDFENPDYVPSIIDHNFATHILVAVCKTTIDPSNGRIVVNLVETFFGSLFDERDPQNGRSLFIGDIINGDNGSDYIQFFRNDYVSAGDKGAYDPPEYRRTDVNQIFIKDSEALRNAATLRGIDYEDYGCDALDPDVKAKNEADYYNDLHKYHIWEIDKKEVCIYNLHWEANLTSFSKKESQKVIANTTGLYSVNDGTTVNVANNFLIDMDRCIKFIKNIDAIPLHFVCDAGLSTIGQFCDNVVWNPKKKTVVDEELDERGRKTGVKKYEQTGGWITQPFDPDNDPDSEDRFITGYEDIATWRKIVEKLASIAQDIRRDCFVIVDAPRQLTLDGAAPKIRRTKFTNNFDKTIGKALRYITGFNSSYVAGYYNWLRTTDQYTGRSIWIPPTSKIIGNYCFLNISNLPWLAPAGLTYGLISGCHAVSHNPDPQEEDQIYMKSWNYIKQYPLEGLVVEGQRTLLGKQSNFERINVRLLFLDLERYAYNVSRTFKYQVNNAYTREQFVATLKPKFEDYTLRGGIYQYYIKVDETNNTPETIDANELRGDIFIKPARLIEFILLNFTATSTAFDFSELQLG